MPDESSTQFILSQLRSEIHKRQLSNTENFDKAVLSLGTTFLGFSVAFIKDFAPMASAEYSWLLPASWALFGLSIVSTICSFFTSQIGLDIQLRNAERYYLNNDVDSYNKRNLAAIATEFINYLSAIFFILAVVSTIVFTSVNLDKGKNMSNKSNVVFDGASIPAIIQRGANTPSMQQIVPLGAQVPAMQPVSQPASTGTTQTSPSNSPSTSNGGGSK